MNKSMKRYFELSERAAERICHCPFDGEEVRHQLAKSLDGKQRAEPGKEETPYEKRRARFERTVRKLFSRRRGRGAARVPIKISNPQAHGPDHE